MNRYLYEKEKRYEESLYIAVQLTGKLPDNVIFLYKKAEKVEQLNNMDDALDVYREIVSKNNPGIKGVTVKSEKKSVKLKN